MPVVRQLQPRRVVIFHDLKSRHTAHGHHGAGRIGARAIFAPMKMTMGWVRAALGFIATSENIMMKLQTNAI